MKIFFLLFFSLAKVWAGDLPSCKTEWKKGEGKFSDASYQSYYHRTQRKNCEKDWTVLVYMAADNDLHPYALMDLYEMEAAFESSDSAGSTDNLDLIVQVDGIEKNDERRLHIFSSKEVYQRKPLQEFERKNLDSVHSPVVASLQENRQQDSQERLKDFLLWGTETYPSKYLMVIVWGHGQGWKAYPIRNQADGRYLKRKELPEFPVMERDESFGGIAFRGSNGDRLSIPDLRDSLIALKALRGKPVDVYASDSCLMQMFEVAYELNESSRFVVGSTQIQNFLGLPYRRMIYEMNTGRFFGEKKTSSGSVSEKDEPYFVAKMLPSLMKKSLDPKSGLQGRSDPHAQKFMTSSSLTSLEASQYLVPALAQLGFALEEYLEEDRLRSMDVRFVLQNVPTFEGGAQDMAVFFSLLKLLLVEEEKGGAFSAGSQRLLLAIESAEKALHRSVLSYAYGDSYLMDENSKRLGFFPKALSLWLPVEKNEYQKRRSEFLESHFFRDTGWQGWLDLVFLKNE